MTLPNTSRSTQQRIQVLLDSLVADGRERGVQVAAYLGGKPFVDAWAGIADHNSGKPVDGQTLFPVFSTTKGIAATLIHLLVERGRISYDTRIADVWPAFATGGKDRITLRQVLNHSAGIPQMPAKLTHGELCDWDFMCNAIAALEPIWPPGTRIEYHAMTFGWIVGEVARRVDGHPFARLLEDEICCPLGLDSMYVGTPDSEDHRIALLEDYRPEPPPPDNAAPQSVPHGLGQLHTLMNRADARRACIPATNGIMNARSIARLYAALLPGGVDGVELLPPARIRLATEPQKPEHPQNDNYPKSWGLGYQLGGNGSSLGESPLIFGHIGHGGSVGLVDPTLHLAFGFTRNLFQKSDTLNLVLAELRTGAIHSAPPQ